MKKQLLLIPAIVLVILLAACSELAADTEPTSSAALEESDEIIVPRTPLPTATPDFIAREIDQFVRSRGLQMDTFLGFPTDSWINLFISLLIIGLAYIFGTVVTVMITRWIVRHTSSEFGEVFNKSIGPRVKWLIIIPAFYFATIRLDFLSSALKTLLSDIYFVMALTLSALIVWSLLDLGYEFYRQKFAKEGREEQIVPILLLLIRILRVIVIAIAFTILLSHFGININALIAAMGIGGLALSLAAQDTLADAIAGFIILADQPYRIGDRIEIQGEGTWGDVREIGLRTTRIRTRDNRMVIVPNSIISKNQVVNYTFPDPRYRIQTHIGIGYGSDVEQVRKIIVDTVRQVEGVLPDQPVDSLYVEMGDSAMIFRVRWWLESYEDTRMMFDRVNTALQSAFDAGGIQLPYPIHTTRLEVDDEAAINLSTALGAGSPAG